MNNFDRLLEAWRPIGEEFNQTPGMRRLREGSVTLDHYKSVVKEISHHARENPQIQTLAAVYFRGKQRNLIKKFFQHATSEIGHDQLALNDLAVLGTDVSAIPFQRPLPDTTALLSFAFYQIQFLNPLGYLGYLFHLEFAPTQHGSGYMEQLQNLGIPKEAMSFLTDHSSIDVGHNRLMQTYVEGLVENEDDFDDIVHAMRVTAHLYGNMIQGALEQADRPRTWGLAPDEVRNADKSVATTLTNSI